MPFDIANAITTPVAAGIGLALENHNDKRQLKQQGKLQALQIAGQQQMVDYNYQKEMEMWHNTNYGAQMAELAKAGLNPALMYKQGGPGGTTGTATGNVSGASAPAGGMEIQNMMMQQAQIELMKAQTKKTTAEAETVAPQAAAVLENLKADTANKEVQGEILDAESDLKNVEVQIAEKTQGAAQAIVLTNLRRFTAEMHMAETQERISSETADNNIKIVAAHYAGLLLTNKEIKAKIGLTDQQAEQVKKTIEEMPEKLKIEQGRLKLEQGQQQWEQGSGSIIHGAVDKLFGLLPSLIESKTNRKTGGKH